MTATTLSTTMLYNSITRDYSQSLENTAKQPQIQRETNYFVANIGKVTSASQLVNNPQLYNYVMTAFGLQDMTYAKALIIKVLNGGDGSNSFAASLNNASYLELAATFNFAQNGASTTSQASVLTTTVGNYNEQALETQAGNQDPGVQMALYFRRMAPDITSPYNILADSTLLKVFETVFNLPTSFSEQNIDTQAAEVSKLLDISKLQNYTYLNNFIQRFTATYDAQNPTGGTGTATSNPTNALLVSSTGISSNLLLSLANLKLGGS